MSATGTASIYVGDLADAVTEQNLHQTFCRAGHIQSVRLCREALTGQSKGYGYVNFSNASEAQRAVNTLNHAIICGQPVRVMPSQRDASTRRSGIGNIFVKNLDQDLVTNKMLHDHFSQFGKILSAKVALDADKRSRGYGFVQFAEAESANRAILTLDATDFCGQTLSVAEFIPAKDRAAEPGKFFNIYVKNIGSMMDEEGLRLAFSRYGPMTSTVVMRNSRGRSRGFGFVNFKDSDHAATAVAEMDGHVHDGLRWKVNGARRRDHNPAKEQPQQRLDRTHLSIKNLNAECTEAELRQAFEVFGALQSLRLIRGAAGLGSGLAFIQFRKAEDAEAAITGLNGQMIGPYSDHVSVTLAPHKAQSEGDRQRPQLYSGLASADDASSQLPRQLTAMQPVLAHPSVAYYPGPQLYYGHPFTLQAGQGQLPPPYVQLQAPVSSQQHPYERISGLIRAPSGGPYLGQGSPAQMGSLHPVMRVGNSTVPFLGYESPPQYWLDQEGNAFLGSAIQASEPQQRSRGFNLPGSQSQRRRAPQQQPAFPSQGIADSVAPSSASWLRPTADLFAALPSQLPSTSLATLGLPSPQSFPETPQPSQLVSLPLPTTQIPEGLTTSSALIGQSGGGEAMHSADLLASTAGLLPAELAAQILREGSLQGPPPSTNPSHQ